MGAQISHLQGLRLPLSGRKRAFRAHERETKEVPAVHDGVFLRAWLRSGLAATDKATLQRVIERCVPAFGSFSAYNSVEEFSRVAETTA